MKKRQLGGRYEERAAGFLEGQGYRIVERNHRNRMGEIDLIGWDGPYLVFVEVKYRRNGARGRALEAVDLRKRQRLSQAALCYRMQERIPEEIPCRFDVVGIDGGEVTLVKNAFDLCCGGVW